MQGKIVVTVLGSDKVGIVAGVSEKLSELNVNIVDITQTIFEGGIFAMIMLVEGNTSNVDLEQFNKEMGSLGEKLKVKIYAQHENIFKYMHRI